LMSIACNKNNKDFNCSVVKRASNLASSSPTKPSSDEMNTEPRKNLGRKILKSMSYSKPAPFKLRWKVSTSFQERTRRNRSQLASERPHSAWILSTEAIRSIAGQQGSKRSGIPSEAIGVDGFEAIGASKGVDEFISIRGPG